MHHPPPGDARLRRRFAHLIRSLRGCSLCELPTQKSKQVLIQSCAGGCPITLSAAVYEKKNTADEDPEHRPGKRKPHRPVEVGTGASWILGGLLGGPGLDRRETGIHLFAPRFADPRFADPRFADQRYATQTWPSFG